MHSLRKEYTLFRKYIPQSKRSAICEIWKDSDGYWITLNIGWVADRTDSNARVIHEWTIKDLRYQIAGIKKIES